MRERNVENYFKRMVEEAGGHARKLITPGRRHAPDRLVLWPQASGALATIDFVELKKPGKTPRPGQGREHARLRKWGFNVVVIDSHRRVDEYIQTRRV